jgi:hypothetical protein
MTRARRYGALVASAIALALLSSAASLATTRTTAPGTHVLVYFVIEKKKVAYEILRTTAGGGTDQLFLEKNASRGDVATFYVINRDKKRHGFTFYGHEIKSIKPGQRVHFSATLLRRGSFPYASTPSAGKAFRGVFPVL